MSHHCPAPSSAAASSKGCDAAVPNPTDVLLLPAQSCTLSWGLQPESVSSTGMGLSRKVLPQMQFALGIQVMRNCAISQNWRGFSSPSSFVRTAYVHDSFWSSWQWGQEGSRSSSREWRTLSVSATAGGSQEGSRSDFFQTLYSPYAVATVRSHEEIASWTGAAKTLQRWVYFLLTSRNLCLKIIFRCCGRDTFFSPVAGTSVKDHCTRKGHSENGTGSIKLFFPQPQEWNQSCFWFSCWKPGCTGAFQGGPDTRGVFKGLWAMQGWAEPRLQRATCRGTCGECPLFHWAPH